MLLNKKKCGLFKLGGNNKLTSKQEKEKQILGIPYVE